MGPTTVATTTGPAATARGRSRRGVTLIEMLIAIALLSILLGGVFAFWRNLTSGRDRVTEYVAREQAARVFLDRLESQLACTLVSDPQHGSGVVGSPFAVRLLTRSVAVDRSPSGENTALGDLQMVEYRFDRVGNRLTARSGPAGSPGDWVTVAEDFGLVRFRYLDGNQWSGSCNARSSNRLPVAIEVAIWFRPIAPEDAGFGDLTMGGDETGSGRGTSTSRDTRLFGRGAGFGGEADAAAASDVVGSLDAESTDWGALEAEPTPVERYEALEPDRLLVIVVPDAPEFEYGRTYSDTADDDFGG